MALALVLAALAPAACATEADGALPRDPAGSRRTPRDRPADTDDDAASGPDTTTAPPTTAATTTTTEAPPGLADGTYAVGTDIAPGRYVAAAPDALCSWERLSGLSGSHDDVIAFGGLEGPAIVDVTEGDAAFRTTGCGRWVPYAPSGAQVTEFGPGDWVVGDQIAPGTYRSDGELCMWERATGFGHHYDEILAWEFPEGPTVVDIAGTDVRFSSAGCGTWTPA